MNVNVRENERGRGKEKERGFWSGVRIGNIGLEILIKILIVELGIGVFDYVLG